MLFVGKWLMFPSQAQVQRKSAADSEIVLEENTVVVTAAAQPHRIRQGGGIHNPEQVTGKGEPREVAGKGFVGDGRSPRIELEIAAPE